MHSIIRAALPVFLAASAILCLSGCKKDSPTEPKEDCEIHNTAIMYVQNAAHTVEYGIYVDGTYLFSLSPGATGGPHHVSAGNQHTLEFRREGTNENLSTQYINLEQCSSRTFSCAAGDPGIVTLDYGSSYPYGTICFRVNGVQHTFDPGDQDTVQIPQDGASLDIWECIGNDCRWDTGYDVYPGRTYAVVNGQGVIWDLTLRAADPRQSPCEVGHYAIVDFSNQSNTTYDIIWDGVRLTTLAPGDTSEHYATLAGEHTLTFQRSTDGAILCSGPENLVQCHTYGWQCGN